MIRRRLVFAAVLAFVGVLAPTAYATSEDGASECTARVLVLAAMPLELDPLLRAAVLDSSPPMTRDGRTFYFGTLGGKDVVLAMTGIGMVNAEETTALAYRLADELEWCPFTATLFSGVAGSVRNIGDVAVPASWTADDGQTWLHSDPAMLGVARRLAARGSVPLSRVTPVGDAACLCPGIDDPGTPITMPHDTKLWVGGQGTSSDNFNKQAVPCLPGGGDVAGCDPCVPGATDEQAKAFADKAPDLMNPAFVEEFLRPPDATTDEYQAQDMETAAAAFVANEHDIPFLGIRAVSDGPGDPLHLPGFPWQFFVYRRLAGNNAAAVTEAILRALPAGVAS